jgi:hypothetical protein
MSDFVFDQPDAGGWLTRNILEKILAIRKSERELGNQVELEYAAVYHCTIIHISQWLKTNYGQIFYQIWMKNDLKFGSDTMLSDLNENENAYVP